MNETKASRLIYIASPVRSLLTSQLYKDEALRAIKLVALQACREVLSHGDVPFSPVLALSGLFDEESERDKIMALCHELLFRCDHIYIADHPLSRTSKGILQERKWAKEMNIAEVEYV